MSPLPLIALAKVATPFIVRTALPYISRVAIPMVARNVTKIAPVIGKTVVQQVAKGKEAMISATNLAKNNISAVSAHARNQGNAIVSTVKSSVQSNLDKATMGARLAKDAVMNATPKQVVGAAAKGYVAYSAYSTLSGDDLSKGEKILKDRLSVLSREADNIQNAFKEERVGEYLSSLSDRVQSKDSEYVKDMLKNNATVLDIASILPTGYIPYNIATTVASTVNCTAIAGTKFYKSELSGAALAKETAACFAEPVLLNKAETFSTSGT